MLSLLSQPFLPLTPLLLHCFPFNVLVIRSIGCRLHLRTASTLKLLLLCHLFLNRLCQELTMPPSIANLTITGPGSICYLAKNGSLVLNTRMIIWLPCKLRLLTMVVSLYHVWLCGINSSNNRWALQSALLWRQRGGCIIIWRLRLFSGQIGAIFVISNHVVIRRCITYQGQIVVWDLNLARLLAHVIHGTRTIERVLTMWSLPLPNTGIVPCYIGTSLTSSLPISIPLNYIVLH